MRRRMLGRTVGGGGLPYTPPLDAQNASAAYSVRLLRTAYTGDCCKVYRISDGVEQDIGFDSNGLLDTAALTSFIGGGTGWVVTWYDQTGNGLDASAFNPSNAPTIIASGTIQELNSNPCLRFNGASDYFIIPGSSASFNYLHNGTESDVFFVGKAGVSSNPNNWYVILNNGGFASATVGMGLAYEDRSSFGWNDSCRMSVARGVSGTASLSSIQSNTFTANTQVLISAIFDADNPTAVDRGLSSLNGGSYQGDNTSLFAPSTANANSNMYIGRFAASGIGYYTGDMQELIIYDTPPSRATVKTNINSYYSIY